MESGLDRFIGLYQRPITLNIKLIPQGKTLEYIQKEHILEEDQERSENYQEAKTVLDSCYKQIIAEVLGNPCIALDWEPLANAWNQLHETDNTAREAARENLHTIQAEQRKTIVDLFENYCDIHGNNVLEKMSKIQWVGEQLKEQYELEKRLGNDSQDDDEAAKPPYEVLLSFKGFNSYFDKYNQSRKNMFTAEEKQTAIATRLVNDNFPTFLHNITQYNKMQKLYPDIARRTAQELYPYFGDLDIAEYFTVNGFNRVLAQTGIDVYNQILGGIAEDDATKLRGLNEFCNLAYQATRQTDPSGRIHFTPLHKQILSDSESLSFVYDRLQTDDEAVSCIFAMDKELHLDQHSSAAPETLGEQISPVVILKDILTNIRTGGYSSSLMIKRANLDDFSYRLSSNKDRDMIRENLERCANNLEGPCSNMKRAAAKKWAKSKVFTLGEILSAMPGVGTSLDALHYSGPGWDLADFEDYVQSVFDCISLDRRNVLPELEKYQTPTRKLLDNNADRDQAIKAIKDYLDSLNRFLRLCGLFDCDLDEAHDQVFYIDYKENLDIMRSAILPTYNKFRNYVTQKPYSTEKFKLNFRNESLGKGWDSNKTRDNGAVFLRKNNLFYLAVAGPKGKGTLASVTQSKDDPMAGSHSEDGAWKVFIMHQVPLAGRLLPTLYYSQEEQKVIRKTTDRDDVMRENLPANIYPMWKEKTYNKSDGTLSREDLNNYIAYSQFLISNYNNYDNVFSFRFKDPADYADYYDFINDVNAQAYSAHWEEISGKALLEAVDAGTIYLFQLYNKDFAQGASGRKNLHTLFLEEMFSDEDNKDAVIALNGGAELFYRPASIDKPFTHEKESILVNKTLKGINEHIPDDIYSEIQQNKNKINGTSLSSESSTFLRQHAGQIVTKRATHPIVKDKRYSVGQFELHLPITLNNQASAAKIDLNSMVLDYIAGNPDVNIIGIKRSECNLLYAVVIDQQGNILTQRNLNVVNGVNHWNLLRQRAGDRQGERVDWRTVTQIKDQKRGYVSAAVHEVTDLIRQYNAIVVLENFNDEFRAKRYPIDHATYQQFEKALMTKLQYLAAKPEVVAPDQPGGILKGYQLCGIPRQTSKMRPQWGFVFHVSPWNTSRIDPETGFANLFVGTKYKSERKSRDFFRKFDSITYNTDTDSFDFAFSYSNFDLQDYQDTWTVTSAGGTRRIAVNTDKKDKKTVDVTDEIKTVLTDAGIPYEDGSNLVSAIVSCEKVGFFKKLFYLFMGLVELRYPRPGENAGEDYILSPIRMSDGSQFDSRKANEGVPRDAGANGAYSVALKGLLLITEQVETKQEADGALRLSIKENNNIDKQNLSWLTFIQSKPFKRE